jgi:hypothetical protein
MGSMVSNSVVQPVPGGSTTSGSGGFFGRLIEQALNSGILQQVNQPTQDSGITSLPINTQPVNQISSPTTPVRGYNQVRDPRLNRTAMRPMFRTSKYDNRIGDLLNRLMPQTENKADGGRIGYADGTPVAGLAIQLDRPVQPGDPVGSFYTPTNISSLAPVAPTGKVLKPEYQNGIPIGLVMPQDFYYMDAPITPTQNTSATPTTLSSLPITRSNPLMNTLRKFNQVRDPRIARLLQQRQARAMGGIMNLKVGGLPAEMDYRASGGFVPIGKKERADDVPARLSKNEFVFTANAVRNAGGGDIRKGAKRMYNLMHQLEAKK